MQHVNIHQAKTHLSSLIEKVAVGESFVIAKSGKPMAKVIPFSDVKKQRVGFLKGRVKVPDDFDRMGTDEITGLFKGIK